MADEINLKANEIVIKGNQIYSPIRRKWLLLTPEERVRQEYLLIILEEYGYNLEQIAEEMDVTGRGSAQARADFVIWRTIQDKLDQKPPFIIVECKSDNIAIKAKDYAQGEHYARMSGSPFFVTRNSRETRYWRIKRDRMPGYIEEIENIPHSDATEKEIEDLLSKLRVFREKEFADLLHQCHNVIRNREKKDPAAAFDEIAKILFIKVWVERELRKKQKRINLFSVEFLDEQLSGAPLDDLFQKTKQDYAADKIFEGDERINLKPATGREIVRLLEKYNLSDTSEDIKGVAFERFLGRTFRGEIGQFFTPRSIVEFMVLMVDPKEGELICDPASGSGGFLIRAFEIVREKILSDADREYNEFKRMVEADSTLSDLEKAQRLHLKYEEIRGNIDQHREGSRLWKLANRCIYGMDANDRMARTSKMNMIMHGDGHGGVHHHDGFLNVNGIFEGRFDIILTNPPFGANVEPSDRVLESDVVVSPSMERRYYQEYGELYRDSQVRLRAAINKPIASMFELPKSPESMIKTEILFIERCLNLLKPGGRLGIVLPEGVFNNPSLGYVREYVEDRAFIRAVISLPQETFSSSGANVKASLLFLQKFTEEEKQRFDEANYTAWAKIDGMDCDEIAVKLEKSQQCIQESGEKNDYRLLNNDKKTFKNEIKKMKDERAKKSRQLLKEYFDYIIFMYKAERVGITATGEDDLNELYPNGNQPNDIEKTCLEWYLEFLKNPDAIQRVSGH